ncbi:hypothetical protein HPB50_017045 [Hyalomma asiaticum]|uniref:Uncharacterized protein n=1 Tax=Hyalomma asiaticum TaxID=266040 RepID=A0ACB7TJ37_HYAAI|nr:hypothetical protein HPB50_017045 [Hyalomma asiaticum]
MAAPQGSVPANPLTKKNLVEPLSRLSATASRSTIVLEPHPPEVRKWNVATHVAHRTSKDVVDVALSC